MYKAGGLAPPTAAVPFYCSPVTLKRPLADERRTTGAMLEHLYGLFWGVSFPVLKFAINQQSMYMFVLFWRKLIKTYKSAYMKNDEK